MPINDIRSSARSLHLLTYDAYDRSTGLETLRKIAWLQVNTTRQTPYELEWAFLVARLMPWVDKKTIQRLYKHELTIRPEDYELTYPYDRTREGEPGQMLNKEQVAGYFANGYLEGRTELVRQTLYSNPICWDGQNFFDSDHPHLDESGTYSNILPAGSAVASRSTAASPTLAELAAEFRSARTRLLNISRLTNNLQTTAVVDTGLVAIARSQAVFDGLDQLRTLDRLTDGGPANDLKGKFELMYDHNNGTSNNYWELIRTAGTQLRPVIQLPWGTEMPEIRFGAEDFQSKVVPFGIEAKIGTAPGFPQTCVRVYT
jgi:hypothetical protein